MGVRYPQVRVQLTGADGNPLEILGQVKKAMKKAKLPPETYEQFRSEAVSGDHDHFMATVMAWVTTE